MSVGITKMKQLTVKSTNKQQRTGSEILFPLCVVLMLLCLCQITLVAQTASRIGPAIPLVRVTNQDGSIASLERHIFGLVNSARIMRGRADLTWSPKAAGFSRMNSQVMAEDDSLNHVGASGQRLSERADEYGLLEWTRIGENIGYNRGSKLVAEAIVASWMKSSVHRDLLLDKRWSESGVGVAEAKDGGYYFTQIFLVPKK